jgi:hypothetical protein
MTEYEQDLYDVIADWWDIIFDINPAPVVVMVNTLINMQPSLIL